MPSVILLNNTIKFPKLLKIALRFLSYHAVLCIIFQEATMTSNVFTSITPHVNVAPH